MVTVLDRVRIRGKAAGSQETDDSGGGGVDETQKRLTAIEATQAKTEGILQNLATKAELADLRAEMLDSFGEVRVALEKLSGRLFAIESLMPHMATKADLKGEISSLHVSMIKWIVGTAISCTAVACAFFKLFG